ncbi:MAG: hypothetical protein ABIP75_04335 [Pyrinomonadaceae bacterium]
MKKTLFLAVAVICAAFLLASCDKLSSNSNSGSNGNNSNSGKSGDSKPGDTTASSGDIGVPECDAYIKKYEACINDKVPAASKDIMKNSFDQMRKSWKAAAATPEGKAGLANACTQAMDAAKKSMGAYGCDF